MKLRWLGNSCVEILGEKHILIDPNYIIEPYAGVEFVLVTHEHSDHIDIEKLEAIDYRNLIAPQKTLEIYELEGIPANPGEEIDGIKILESWCWKSEESVSYLYSGLLHAGDSARFPDVKAKVVFTACFPDFYEEYVREMKKISPEMVIPVHFSPEKRRNAEGLKEKLNREGIACRILEVGEELQID